MTKTEYLSNTILFKIKLKVAEFGKCKILIGKVHKAVF